MDKNFKAGDLVILDRLDRWNKKETRDLKYQTLYIIEYISKDDDLLALINHREHYFISRFKKVEGKLSRLFYG